jgi:hypothetical protein
MTEKEFLEFWNNYQWTDPAPVYYRLYHNDAGDPLFYSQEDVPGKYIEVTPKQFAVKDMAIQVVDGKIIQHRTSWVRKLVPADSGTLCHHNDVTVVVADQPGQYWKKKENVVETN